MPREDFKGLPDKLQKLASYSGKSFIWTEAIEVKGIGHEVVARVEKLAIYYYPSGDWFTETELAIYWPVGLVFCFHGYDGYGNQLTCIRTSYQEFDPPHAEFCLIGQSAAVAQHFEKLANWRISIEAWQA